MSEEDSNEPYDRYDNPEETNSSQDDDDNSGSDGDDGGDHENPARSDRNTDSETETQHSEQNYELETRDSADRRDVVGPPSTDESDDNKSDDEDTRDVDDERRHNDSETQDSAGPMFEPQSQEGDSSQAYDPEFPGDEEEADEEQGRISQNYDDANHGSVQNDESETQGSVQSYNSEHQAEAQASCDRESGQRDDNEGQSFSPEGVDEGHGDPDQRSDLHFESESRERDENHHDSEDGNDDCINDHVKPDESPCVDAQETVVNPEADEQAAKVGPSGDTGTEGHETERLADADRRSDGYGYGRRSDSENDDPRRSDQTDDSRGPESENHRSRQQPGDSREKDYSSRHSDSDSEDYRRNDRHRHDRRSDSESNDSRQRGRQDKDTYGSHSESENDDYSRNRDTGRDRFGRDRDRDYDRGRNRESERVGSRDDEKKQNGTTKKGPISLMALEITPPPELKNRSSFEEPKFRDRPAKRFSGGGAPSQDFRRPPRSGFGHLMDADHFDDRKRGPEDSDRFGKRPRFAVTGANAEPFVPRHQKVNPNAAPLEPMPMRRGPPINRAEISRIYECVEKAVTPLCRLPIPGQLQKKHDMVRLALDTMRKEITEANPATNTWFLYQEAKYQAILELRNVVPSPLVDGYRSKCEFTIGMNPAEHHILTIGYIVEQGTSLVGPVDHLRHVPAQTKQIVHELQLGLRDSQIPPFDVTTGMGHWMTLTVRLTSVDDAQVIVAFKPQNMTHLQVRDVKEKLTRFFAEGPGQKCRVTSLYFNIRPQWDSGTFELLYGSEFITELLFGKGFRISPQSYFAINPMAHEKVCLTVAELARPNLSCAVVDICCGTGGLGLSLADKAGQVVGLDIVEASVEDARMSAMKNNITNCEFYPGSAEDYLPNLFQRVAFTEAICLIDPPRGGIASKAINHIRKNDTVKKLVYICNDPFSYMKNFADLSRPPSNNFKGDPFIPVCAVPIDTFPHTNNFCIVVLFLRLSMTDIVNPHNVTPQRFSAPVQANVHAQYPEPTPYGLGQPGPDLRWQKVTPSKPDEASLSAEQVAWLNQMTETYGAAFERQQWIETFKHQNMEAGMAAAAPVSTPVPPPSAPSGGNAEADSAAAWAAYSKQYREYKEWWDQYGSKMYGAAGYQQPGQTPGTPDSWATYGQGSYYSNWQQGQQPPLPNTPAPPLPKTPAPK